MAASDSFTLNIFFQILDMANVFLDSFIGSVVTLFCIITDVSPRIVSASLLFGASSGAAGVSASSDASAPQTSVGFGVISGSAQGKISGFSLQMYIFTTIIFSSIYVGNSGPGSSAPGASSSTGQVAAATTSNVPVGILGTNVPSDISGRSLGDIKKRWNREAKDALVVFKSLASE